MRGDWATLLEEAAAESPPRRAPDRKPSEAEAATKRRQAAVAKVRLREIRRARLVLTSSGLAPGNSATLQELTDTTRRPQSPEVEMPAAALQHTPVNPLRLDPTELARALRAGGRGSATDLAGMRYEHLRVVLEDESAWELFVGMANEFAQATVPSAIMQALRLGRMTALQKGDGRVRGIVAGSVLRRVVCRAVARQYGGVFRKATAPYQFAVQTPAGAEALVLALRALTDADPDAVVLSLDGVGAYDHVHRAAFMDKLLEVPEMRALLPLVSALYGSASRFISRDDEGVDHTIEQGEGGEQGCPLMPALYSLAQHNALAEAAANLRQGERVYSFLDDLYVVTTRDRAAAAYSEVASLVHRRAGVQSNLGKLRGWARGGGPAPPGLAAIEPKAWVADQPAAANGIMVLGSPLGQDAYVAAQADMRLDSERQYLREISQVPDPQCAWLLLSQSAAARAVHTLRTVPPRLSQTYAEAHDTALWKTFCQILGAQDMANDMLARDIASMPGRHGGLGLQSAARTAPAAYWAAVVDALPVLARQDAATAQTLSRSLTDASAENAFSAAGAAASARQQLIAIGAVRLPTWEEATRGAAAPRLEQDSDQDLWARGWQGHASSFTEKHFRERMVWPICDASRRALLHSQGADGSAWLTAIPSEPALTLEPLRMQVALRRRLRWPLPLSGGRCCPYCPGPLDARGDRAAACARSGRLKLRSRPLERTWVRVLREAGARVRENVYLRNAGLPGVQAQDARCVEIVASGLPQCHGVPLAVDATLVSPLRGDGSPHPAAAERPGVSLRRAEQAKSRAYPELVESSVLRLTTAAMEVGGRTNLASRRLLRTAAAARARSEPLPLRPPAARRWLGRWQKMLAVAAQRALAASLVDDGLALLDGIDGEAPPPAELWAAAEAWADDGPAPRAGEAPAVAIVASG